MICGGRRGEDMNKPPLGLMPKRIWDLQRKQDINNAMERYCKANKDIPWEWVQEYMGLSEWYNESKESVLEGQPWD